MPVAISMRPVGEQREDRARRAHDADTLVSAGRITVDRETVDADGPVWGGGPGPDRASGATVTVTYTGHTAPVRVTPDGLADDGGAGEGDDVEAGGRRIATASLRVSGQRALSVAVRRRGTRRCGTLRAIVRLRDPHGRTSTTTARLGRCAWR